MYLNATKKRLPEPTHSDLTPEQRARLRLIRSENVGPVTFHTLLLHTGSAIKALEKLPELARKGGRKSSLHIYTESQLDQELEETYRFGGVPVFHDDFYYPSLLKKIPDAPPVLIIKGNPELLLKGSLAIVGARNASLAGKQIAEKMARELGELQYVIVSGLARGIDAAAHRGSLQTGTIAVVAGGIDMVYPPENQKLHEAICEKGLIIAESPFGTQPMAGLFPRRNRIVSGLCRGILVVEAALKSGSLGTARLAVDQNREVFAIPGNPLDPRAQGCNRLIQQGATLVQDVGDIQQVLELQNSVIYNMVDQIPPMANEPATVCVDSHLVAKSREAIQENLGPMPICVDELIRECQISGSGSLSDVLMILVELELAGKIVRYPGNKVALNMEANEKIL